MTAFFLSLGLSWLISSSLDLEIRNHVPSVLQSCTPSTTLRAPSTVSLGAVVGQKTHTMALTVTTPDKSTNCHGAVSNVVRIYIFINLAILHPYILSASCVVCMFLPILIITSLFYIPIHCFNWQVSPRVTPIPKKLSDFKLRISQIITII